MRTPHNHARSTMKHVTVHTKCDSGVQGTSCSFLTDVADKELSGSVYPNELQNCASQSFVQVKVVEESQAGIRPRHCLSLFFYTSLSDYLPYNFLGSPFPRELAVSASSVHYTQCNCLLELYHKSMSLYLTSIDNSELLRLANISH